MLPRLPDSRCFTGEFDAEPSPPKSPRCFAGDCDADSKATNSRNGMGNVTFFKDGGNGPCPPGERSCRRLGERPASASEEFAIEVPPRSPRPDVDAEQPEVLGKLESRCLSLSRAASLWPLSCFNFDS